MATNTKFITVSDFADYEDISTYLDDTKYLDPHILAAQEKQIRPILGNTLYTTLQTEVAGSSLTAANTALIAKIKPVLVYYSYAEYIPHAGVYSTNSGLVEYTSDHAKPASDTRLGMIRRNAQDLADTYRRQLISFLKQNKTIYTTWDECDTVGTNDFPRISKASRKRRNPAKMDFDYTSYNRER